MNINAEINRPDADPEAHLTYPCLMELWRRSDGPTGLVVLKTSAKEGTVLCSGIYTSKPHLAIGSRTGSLHDCMDETNHEYWKVFDGELILSNKKETE